MRKFIAFLITFVYLFSFDFCYAAEMYYLKNININTISNTIKTVFAEKDYTLKKENPFYAISNENSADYAVIVVQPNGQDIYYYADTTEKKLNKAILKSLKKQNIDYNEYENATHFAYFSETARKVLSGESTTYSFQKPVKTTLSNPKVLQGSVKKVGRGTVLDVYLQHAINTATANVGDNVVAVLKSNWMEDSHVIAPQGSILYGSLTEANHARMGMRNGGVEIDFNKLVTPDGKTYKLVTQKIDFDVTNEGQVTSSLKKVATATAIGAVAGILLSLLGSGDYIGRGAAIGAGVAGGVALMTSAASKGVDAEIPSYTELQVVIDEDVKVILNY